MPLPKTLLSSVAVLCAATATPVDLFLETLQTSAQQLANCPALADDVASETAAKLWQRHRSRVTEYDPEDRGYIHRCVLNTLRDELRRRIRLAQLQEPLEVVPELVTDDRPGGDDAFEHLTVAEFRGRISSRQNEILTLLEEGRTEREIAERLGITRHAVRTGMARLAAEAADYFGPTESNRKFDRLC
jgi:RNA polymerase sigma factor (sigma-70 family)